ncbi:hypothetical protein VUR80DRAFT_3429 [Thermomyces stellatus]
MSSSQVLDNLDGSGASSATAPSSNHEAGTPGQPQPLQQEAQTAVTRQLEALVREFDEGETSSSDESVSSEDFIKLKQITPATPNLLPASDEDFHLWWAQPPGPPPPTPVHTPVGQQPAPEDVVAMLLSHLAAAGDEVSASQGNGFADPQPSDGVNLSASGPISTPEPQVDPGATAFVPGESPLSQHSTPTPFFSAYQLNPGPPSFNSLGPGDNA